MSARTDTHSPLNLITEDYEYIGGFDSQQGIYDIIYEFNSLTGDAVASGQVLNEGRARLHSLLAESTTSVYHGGQCDHCGAHLRYVAVLKHRPTGQHIAVGETCLDNRFSRATADFHALRKQAQLDREKQRLLTAWTQFKEDHSLVDWGKLYASENTFIQDVLRKGRQYGNISDRQLDAIVKAYNRDVERALAKANEVVVPRVPIPTGKQVITGKLVSIKSKESQWGTTLKATIVVTTPEGEYVVWGTLPKGLEGQWGCTGCGSTGVVCNDTCISVTDPTAYAPGYAYIGAADIGDIVTLSASVERSDRDESFGFFKRPTKAAVVAKAGESTPEPVSAHQAPAVVVEAAAAINRTAADPATKAAAILDLFNSAKGA